VPVTFVSRDPKAQTLRKLGFLVILYHPLQAHQCSSQYKISLLGGVHFILSTRENIAAPSVTITFQESNNSLYLKIIDTSVSSSSDSQTPTFGTAHRDLWARFCQASDFWSWSLWVGTLLMVGELTWMLLEERQLGCVLHRLYHWLVYDAKRAGRERT
jgi:hypothetical protein